MIIKKASDGNYYVFCKRFNKYSHRGSPTNSGLYYISFSIRVPKELEGKRLRFKVEVE